MRAGLPNLSNAERTRWIPGWAWRLIGGLLAFQVALDILNVVTWDGVQALDVVDLNTEANVPTWFGAMLLAAIATVAAGLGISAKYHRRRTMQWFAVAAGFLGLSLEEVATIHERIGHRFEAADSVADWPLLYLPLMAAGTAVIVLAVRELPPPRALMAGAGLVLFGGVLAVELLSVWTGATLVATLVEENAEVVGEILILVALATTLADRVAASRPHRC